MSELEGESERWWRIDREITIKLPLIIYVFIDYLPSFHFGDFACLEFFQCACRINKRAGKIEYQKHCV